MNSTSKQQGFVLVTALIFLMVLSVLGVMALRGSLFEERFASNDRDLALAREHAALALRDAERDIQGLRFDGLYCAAVPCGTLRPAGVRPINAAEAVGFFSVRNADVFGSFARTNGGVGAAVADQGIYSAKPLITSGAPDPCGKPFWSGADWNDGVPRTCAGAIGVAVPTIEYGTFTDAPFAVAGVPTKPRYLIEMFTLDNMVVGTGSNKLFFRITGVGFGRTTGAGGARTSVTLQTVFSPSN